MWQRAPGSGLWQTGGTANPYRCTGERYDADLDLYYLRARWYNQGTGRFLTRDTYAGDTFAPQTLHKYTYTHNDPVNNIDPSGLLATTGYISANQVNASARPMVYVTGLAVACVYRLTASYLATALEIALFGGTFQFNSGTAPCTVQRKPITCDYDHYKSITWTDIVPWPATYWKTLPHGYRVQFQYRGTGPEYIQSAASAACWQRWRAAVQWYDDPVTPPGT
jgi:RHS repeat-associated protein